MDSIISRRFSDEHMMDEQEYEEDFFNTFPTIDFQILTGSEKIEYLDKTKNYYLTILEMSFQFVQLDSSIIKELEVL